MILYGVLVLSVCVFVFRINVLVCVCYMSVVCVFMCDVLCGVVLLVFVACVFGFLFNECASVLCGVFCGVVWFACVACLCVYECVWC